MRIEILSGTYEIDEEARQFVTAAEEATVAGLAQKLVIRQRRQVEKEERQRQKEQERLERLRQADELKRINLSRALDGLPPVYDLSEVRGKARADEQ